MQFTALLLHRKYPRIAYFHTVLNIQLGQAVQACGDIAHSMVGNARTVTEGEGCEVGAVAC